MKAALARKGVSAASVEVVLAADASRRDLLPQAEQLKHQQNEASKQIPQLEGNAKAKVLDEMKAISTKRKAIETEVERVKNELEKGLQALPNPPHASAPDGADDTENVVERTWGEKPAFNFAPKEHWELAEKLGILDTERSAKVSGARFYYLRDELAILQRSLMFWAFTELVKKGYSATIPPFMTRRSAIEATGYYAKDENYCVNPDDEELYLIGTSEVPMMSFHGGEVIDEANLPLRYSAYSPCFRREAGSYGKDTKGIFRVHQFEKVEMVVLCTPEMSEKIHTEILEIEEGLMRQLGIHYQVVNVCCGDFFCSEKI